MANLTREDLELIQRRVLQLEVLFREHDRLNIDWNQWAIQMQISRGPALPDTVQQMVDGLNKSADNRLAVWREIQIILDIIKATLTNAE